jgi:predicted amidohydrolase YtcJ
MASIDHLLVNGRIHTLDPQQPHADSIAIAGDQIVAVGGHDLRSLITPTTKITDLGGAMVVPGLTDAHLHWEGTARALKSIDLLDIPSKQAAIDKVAAAAQNVSPGAWLVGRGWSQSIWKDTDGAFPSAADLDAITPNNPVYLPARSGHAAWVNSAALRAANIDANTPDPDGGQFQRDAHGQPTGILFERAIGMVGDIVPHPTPDELASMMLDAQALAWRSGLTGFHDYDDQSCFEALQLLYERGQLGLRVLKNINRAFIDHALGFKLRFGFGDSWIRVGAFKLFADGALGSRTASMIEPYRTDPDNHGIVVIEKEEMAALVEQATRAGLPSTIHAIGDRAVHDVLDVFDAVRALEATLGIPRAARRHRIEHVQLIHPNDVRRLAELDIIASMQPIHATSDYPMADRYWGERSKYGYNPRLQLDSGARVAFGSDSPVESFDPLAGIHAAVTRRRADGSPGVDGWYPEARVTLDEALRGYTQGAAYAAGMEAHLGMIRPGYLADLTIFDKDLTAIPSDELLSATVIGTMTGGDWRYQAF